MADVGGTAPGGSHAAQLLSRAEGFLQQALSVPGLDEQVKQGISQCLDQVIHPAIDTLQGQEVGDTGAETPGALDQLAGYGAGAAAPGAGPAAPEPKTLDAANTAAMDNLRKTGSYKKGAKGSDEQQPADQQARKKRLARQPAKA